MRKVGLDYLALDRSGDTLSGGETQRIRLAVQLGPEAGSEGDLIWASDYVIDLGPGSGDKGGRVVAEGTPDEVVRQPTTTAHEFSPRRTRQNIGFRLPPECPQKALSDFLRNRRERNDKVRDGLLFGNFVSAIFAQSISNRPKLGDRRAFRNRFGLDATDKYFCLRPQLACIVPKLTPCDSGFQPIRQSWPRAFARQPCGIPWSEARGSFCFTQGTVP